MLRRLVGDSWKRALLHGALALALFGAGAFVFVWLGLSPIAASSGHWALTQRFLGFAMRNAVETRSIAVHVPSLADPALWPKSAGHYAAGCAPCHGAPGQSRPPLVKQMVPQPPLLQPVLAEWDAEELFWLVKHGLKYTAMPGWVAQQRDDEVWAMVAFLRKLPELDARAYRKLAYGDMADSMIDGGAAAATVAFSDPIGAALADCMRCHGRDGRGRGAGTIPVLAGQHEEYLLASLVAYAAGERASGIMQPVAAALDAPDMRALARVFAAMPGGVAEQPPETGAAAAGVRAAIVRGAALATRGDGARRIPACVQCHGPSSAQRNPLFPRLGGQHADYLLLQLQLFRQGVRGGHAWRELMHQAASALEERDIRDLAAYYGRGDVPG